MLFSDVDGHHHETLGWRCLPSEWRTSGQDAAEDSTAERRLHAHRHTVPVVQHKLEPISCRTECTALTVAHGTYAPLASPLLTIQEDWVATLAAAVGMSAALAKARGLPDVGVATAKS